MASTLETAGGFVGSAVVNAAAVAAALFILRSGRANDPKVIAGAIAFYISVKQTGKLDGAEFGKGLDEFLKEHGIDVDKFFEENYEEYVKPILDEYYDKYPINLTVNTLYNASQEWMSPPPPRRRIDPLVLDLDGDGIETVGITAVSHVVFDGEGDGLKTGSGWVGKDDGLLVLDRNGNGTIDNGSELFGDQTLVNGVKATDGFSALRAEEEVNCVARETTLGCTNADGKFDATDTNYANVRVWQDLNQDGISQTTELKTLTDLSITSINLTSTATNNQNFKNQRSVA